MSNALPKLLSSGFNPSSSRRDLASGISMAATAMLEIHIDNSTPTTRKPNITYLVLFPVIERHTLTSLFPSPDLLMNALKINTPIKNITLMLPKPVLTMPPKESTPNRANSAIASRPVKWNGIASVIQSRRAKIKTASAFCPSGVSVASFIVAIDAGKLTFLINTNTIRLIHI